MKRLCLIGKNITHSLSPKIYSELLHIKHSYQLLDYQNENEIPPLITLMKNFDGINITSPYKFHFLDQLDEYPLNMPVNVLKIDKGKLIGANTDYEALKIILPSLISNNEQIIVLGEGAMSQITSKILTNNGAKFEIFSRKNGKLNLLENFINNGAGNKLIINSCARDFFYNGNISEETYWYDYNYNCPNILSLKNKFKANVTDGLELLYLQAKLAIKFWGF